MDRTTFITSAIAELQKQGVTSKSVATARATYDSLLSIPLVQSTKLNPVDVAAALMTSDDNDKPDITDDGAHQLARRFKQQIMMNDDNDAGNIQVTVKLLQRVVEMTNNNNNDSTSGIAELYLTCFFEFAQRPKHTWMNDDAYEFILNHNVTYNTCLANLSVEEWSALAVTSLCHGNVRRSSSYYDILCERSCHKRFLGTSLFEALHVMMPLQENDRALLWTKSLASIARAKRAHGYISNDERKTLLVEIHRFLTEAFTPAFCSLIMKRQPADCCALLETLLLTDDVTSRTMLSPIFIPIVDEFCRYGLQRKPRDKIFLETLMGLLCHYEWDSPHVQLEFSQRTDIARDNELKTAHDVVFLLVMHAAYSTPVNETTWIMIEEMLQADGGVVVEGEEKINTDVMRLLLSREPRHVVARFLGTRISVDATRLESNLRSNLTSTKALLNKDIAVSLKRVRGALLMEKNVVD